jgi:hypothetical protein
LNSLCYHPFSHFANLLSSQAKQAAATAWMLAFAGLHRDSPLGGVWLGGCRLGLHVVSWGGSKVLGTAVVGLDVVSSEAVGSVVVGSEVIELAVIVLEVVGSE